MGVFLSDVSESLAQDSRTLTQLRSVPKANETVINAERQRQLQLRQELKAFLDTAVTGGDYEPVHPDVFPTLKPGKNNAPFEFEERFKEREQALLDELNAGEKPTSDELQAYRDQLARLEAQKLADGGGDRRQRRIGTFGGGIGALQQGPESRRAGGDLTEMSAEELIKQNPDAEYALSRAQSIYCYAGLDSLVPQQQLRSVRRPSQEIMWQAQITMWVQEDLINALAGLNAAVAEQLPEEKRWVGHLPVKRLVALTVVPPQPTVDSGGRGGRGGRGGSGGEIGTTSLKMGLQSSDPQRDVLSVSLVLVVEAKRLLEVLETLNNAGPYTVLRTDYVTIDPDLTMTGYIYGPDPVLEVTLAMEGALPREKYEEWIPPSFGGSIDQQGNAPGGQTPGGF
jgi:hypothetical protein